MTIRGYRPADAAALADLYRRSVLAIGPRDYGPDQVAAWASLAPTAERMHEAYTDGRIARIATDEADRPLAFADVEADGHIGFLYCAPEAAGQGVMHALYDALEAEAAALGCRRLHVEASEAARRFLLRRGFTVLARRELRIGNVPIHNYAMEKRLEQSSPPAP